ncbi:MAG: hypothetical protein ACOH5I_22145 [Oligoflexus sp.]
MEPSLHQALKKSTHGLHLQLEELPINQALAAGQVSLSDFRYILICHQHIWQQGVEVVNRSNSSCKGYYLEYLGHLQHDLTSIRRYCRNEQRLPLYTAASTGGQLHALGILYVMLGSTLGSRLILQRLKVSNSPVLAYCQHLHFAQKEGLITWQSFLKEELKTPDHGTQIQVQNSACFIFEQLLQSMKMIKPTASDISETSQHA